MINESGLCPVGRAVLIAPYKPAIGSSIIEIPDEILGREQMIEQRATVVAVGRNCWHDEPEPRAQVGDKVLVSRYSGYQAKGTLDGKDYRFVNDRDIFARIEEEKANG